MTRKDPRPANISVSVTVYTLLGTLTLACTSEGTGDQGGENAPPPLFYPFATTHVITQGPKDHYYTNEENWDVDCWDGEELRAPVSGLVVKAKQSNTGYGNSIGIEVPGWGTMHLNHLHSIDVAEGCWVNASEVVGKCGKTGSVTALNGGDGSHLDVYAVDLEGKNIDLPSPKYWPIGPESGSAKCGAPGGECGCEGTIDDAVVDGNTLTVAGSLHCDGGIDKWSIVVQETTVRSDYPDSDSADFYEVIDLGLHDFSQGSNAVGLWARPLDADACLLDDTTVILEGTDDGCVDTGDTICVGNDVYFKDACGEPGDLAESCTDGAVCVTVSSMSAACKTPSLQCAMNGVDPGEECDGGDLGGATCQSEGFDHGQLTCTPACTLDTSGCCRDDDHAQCSGGDVYWYDSCGGVGGLKQACSDGETCVDTSPTTASCSSTCGDGKVDPGEDCDGGDLGGKSCQDLGHEGGSLACTGQCTFDESACESCSVSSYWTPTPTTQTDQTGMQSNATIDEPIRMEVRENGPGLEFRVCKQNGVFMNNVKVSIHDFNDESVGKLVSTLATANKSCSAWTSLNNADGYAEGEQFVGTWNLVSPDYVADDWPDSGPCQVMGDPWGTCWSASGISLTRTCK
jgi:hypothetical protein